MANDDLSNAEADWSPTLVKAAVAALLGGLLGFAILQFTDPIFKFPDIPELTLNPTDEEVAAEIKAHQDFYASNYAVQMAIVGACIGILFVSLTVPIMKIPSALLAGVLGAAGAAAAAYFGGMMTGEELALSKDQSLIRAALMNVAIWGAMAFGIALGAVVFQRSGALLVKAILAGLIAAILVVVANILVSSIVFPGANSSNYIPLSLAERAVWLVVASLTFGAAMAMGLKPSKTEEAPVGESEFDSVEAKD